jgi:hypothetical protein
LLAESEPRSGEDEDKLFRVVDGTWVAMRTRTWIGETEVEGGVRKVDAGVHQNHKIQWWLDIRRRSMSHCQVSYFHTVIKLKG